MKVDAMFTRRFALSAAFLCLFTAAAAAEGRVIGDSLGVGVSWAAKLPSSARNSVTIHGAGIIEQIHGAPRGATVFMSLGTNDAVGGAVQVTASVNAIVSAAQAQGIRLVWIGPPCVRKPWETHSRTLDGNLQAQLAGTGVVYVSTQDAAFCEASIHAPDGVHFSMTGYNAMWRKAAVAAGFTETAVAAVSKAPTGPTKAKKPKHHAKKHAKKGAAKAGDKAAKPSAGDVKPDAPAEAH